MSEGNGQVYSLKSCSGDEGHPSLYNKTIVWGVPPHLFDWL